MTCQVCDCPICYSAIHSTGLHRLVSLPCGHLFGQSCILQWTRHSLQKSESHPSQAKCPVCNHEYRKSSIRVLYPSQTESSEPPSALASSSVADDAATQAVAVGLGRSTEPEACLECDAYRIKYEALEKASATSRGKYEELKVKYALLKSEALLLESRLAKRAKQDTLAHSSQPLLFQHSQSIAFPHTTAPGSQASFSSIDSDGRDTILWTANRTCSWLSMVDPSFISSQGSSQSQSQGHIRQAVLVPPSLLCSGTESRGTVLYCTMAGELSLYSLASRTFLVTYRQPAPLWSCATNRGSEFQLWAGDAKGTLHAYDTRMTTREPLCSMALSASSRTPVHSLFQYDAAHLVAATFDGLYVVNTAGATTTEQSHDQGQGQGQGQGQSVGMTILGDRPWRPIQDRAAAICTFATMDTLIASSSSESHSKAMLLSTWRRFPLGPEQRSLNVYGTLSFTTTSTAAVGREEHATAMFESVTTFEASNGQKSLGRSSLYRHHVHMIDEPSSSLVVLGYDPALQKFASLQKIRPSGSHAALASSKIIAAKRVADQKLAYVTEDASMHLYDCGTTSMATGASVSAPAIA